MVQPGNGILFARDVLILMGGDRWTDSKPTSPVSADTTQIK
jgi:hypothetical protein